jgi:putative peptidoglycan lipid II flippase
VSSTPISASPPCPVADRGRLSFLRPSHQHTATSATLLLGFFALLSRVIGLIRDKYIAHTFGAGPATDAYNVAFQLPDLITSLLIGGAASISFVTILTRYRERGEIEAGDRALSVILTTISLVLSTGLGLTEFLVPWYSRHFCPNDPAVIALCTSMTRILLPGQVFFFVGGVLASVALVRKQFAFQALAPLVYTSGIILGGILLSHRLGIRSLAWGAFFGALLGPVCVNGYAALRAGARIRPAWDLSNPGLREWVRMSLPLMFGFTVVFMDTYILTFFSRHFAGDISRVLYAKRLFSAPIAILGQAAGAASMPFFASLFSRSLFADFAAAVNRSITRILAVSLLVAAALFALAQPIVDLLLRGGAFSRTDARATAILFAVFTLSLPFWAAQSLYARAFFAAGDTRTPMLGGTAVMLLSIPLYWLLHRHLGVLGLAWASDLAILAQTLTLALLAHGRRLVPLFGLDAAELARSLAAALLSWAGIAFLLHILPHATSTASASHRPALLSLLAGGAVWLLLSLGTLHLTGSRIPSQILRRRSI